MDRFESDEQRMEFASLDRLRKEYVGALVRDRADESAARRAPTRLRFRLVVVPAVGIALLVALVATALWPRGAVVNPAEAAASISRIAMTASLPPDDWFTYSRTLERRRSATALPAGSGPAQLITQSRESWLSVARRGLIKVTDLSSPARRTVEIRYPAWSKYRIGADSYTRSQIEDLADRPAAVQAAIARQLESLEPDQRPLAKWQILIESLTSEAPPLPPALRAELISELGAIPGVSLVDIDRDSRGRPVVVLSLRSQGLIQDVYFDRATSALTSASTRVDEDGAGPGDGSPAGTVLQSFTLLDSYPAKELPGQDARMSG